MLRAFQKVGHTILGAAVEHPKVAAGIGLTGALALLLWADKRVLQPGPSGPAPRLPVGPLPPGTTGLTSYLPDRFFTGIHAMGEHFRSRGATITDEDLIAVIMAESGVFANIPNRVNGVCLGLNQICPMFGKPVESGLRAVGFQGSLTEYSALSETEQLPFMQRFFDNGNHYSHIKDVGSLYLANFSPAFLSPPSVPIWKGRHPIMYARGEKAYTDNATVDTGNKGFIDLNDMSQFVVRSVSARGNIAKWNELRARLQRNTTPIAVAGLPIDWRNVEMTG